MSADLARSEMATPRPYAVGGIVVATGALALWGLTRSTALREQLILDEAQAFEQVKLFLQGQWELFHWPGKEYPAAATLPGFPVLLTLVAAGTNYTSPAALRAICFGIAIVYALTLYGVARHFFPPATALLRAAQGFLLPIVFPFCFLLYTDVPALTIALAGFWAILRGHLHFGSALAVSSLLVRQTNVVFLALVWAYLLIERHGWRPTWPDLVRHSRRCWVLAVGVIGFVLFVLIHGRVGLDHPLQQPMGVSAGNLAVSLVIAALVYLPLHVEYFGVMVRWARTQWKIALGITLVAVVVGLTYSPAHPWNTIPGFLRNELLTALTRTESARLLFGLLAAMAALSIAAVPMVRPAATLLYPYWLQRLLPVVLIEPRYYICSFVLFTLLRTSARPRTEILLWAWFATISVWVHHGMTTGRFIL